MLVVISRLPSYNDCQRDWCRVSCHQGQIIRHKNQAQIVSSWFAIVTQNVNLLPGTNNWRDYPKMRTLPCGEKKSVIGGKQVVCSNGDYERKELNKMQSPENEFQALLMILDKFPRPACETRGKSNLSRKSYCVFIYLSIGFISLALAVGVVLPLFANNTLSFVSYRLFSKSS